MRCASCDEPIYRLDEPCPHCQFKGDPALVEEMAHVNWTLGEIANWRTLSAADRHKITQVYIARQRELEINLGLRLPLFSDEEARKAWPELFRREALLQKMAEWPQAGLVTPAAASAIADAASLQVDDLLEQLEGRARPVYPRTDAERLGLTNFLLEAVAHLSQNNGFVTPEAENQVRAPLQAEKEKLEIKLGLRPAPAPKPSPTPARARAVSPASPAPPAPARPVTPAIPFRDRLWRTLLSERTLQAMLILGIFLLFAAAISFVVWGWRSFSAPLRVAIPTGFTLVFFALGWYVRTQTKLYRSGIALSAIAALLIPVDFYTVYANFHVPPDSAPLFWLLTSMACLVAYIVVTLIIRNSFFGYLVGTAAGSTVLAVVEVAHQSFGFSLDWRTSGLSALAVCLILLATLFSRRAKEEQLRVFAEPFRNLALIVAGALMPLTFGWRYTVRSGFDTLHSAMTINWWLGGFIFGWGAVHYRSRSLGVLAAISLPVAAYMAQAAVFYRAGINPAWHALGWSLLVWLYFVVGRKLQARKDDPVVYGHGRTAAGWGVALLVVAALWSLTDLRSGAAAAISHAILSGAVVLAAVLWQRPRYLYAASLLSVTACTFAMTELNLSLSQLTLGWASLSITHVIIALNVGNRFREKGRDFAGPVVVAGYAIAALALVPPLVPYDGKLLAYALGNWLGLAAWGARLAHVGQAGFAPTPTPSPSPVHKNREQGRGAWPVFHWLTALPLPVWIWLLFANRGPLGFDLPLTLAALAWGMVALSYRLNLLRPGGAYRWPWYFAGLAVSLAAPIAAIAIAPNGFAPAICLLSAGLLYIADAITNRQSLELAPGALVTAWGCALLLDRLRLIFDAVSLALALLIAIYFLAGLWTERKRSPIFTHRWLTPLYLAAHVLSLVLLWRVYVRPLNDLMYDVAWTDEMRVWGAACQLVLGVAYALYAWGTDSERWGHLAAWLIAAGGGFVAFAFSEGRGSSAFKGALGVMVYILAERGLHWLCARPGVKRRRQAFIRLAWRLYRRPLLMTGWIASAGVIGLALVRNLILLGGGRTQQIWAAAGLVTITALYALSARLFRQARFMWLAALLIFVPWTILTNLGWFIFKRPPTPGFALSWVVLAWLLLLAGLTLKRFAARAYVLPPKSVAHVLLPFSLLWGLAHVSTSRFTFALAIGFYGLEAIRDAVRARRGGNASFVSKFLYPALGLIPVWCVYVMAWLLPSARHEHYGLMLLAFGGAGLIAGQWLERVAPRREAANDYALPGYLTGYVSAIVGTLLVAHDAPLLALALLYDAALMLVSARLFKNPLWVYPAAATAPLSLLLALNEAGVPGNRQGWWLIGLAAIYLLLAWTLRRVKLSAYGTAALTVGFALIALGLPPSSRDKIGALWGYGGAAVLYAITAVWLRQPLLLTLACALAIVPYTVGLQLGVRPEYHGLALFPGAVAALALGGWLDLRLGRWRDFPWGDPAQWARASADRLTGWWGLPLYALGFGLAAASPFFADFHAGLSALNCLLLVPLFGWAMARFRLRGWLLATALAGHLAAIYYLQYLGWWRYPAYAWLRFLPVTLLTTAVALWIERRRSEGSPLDLEQSLAGWSRPLYALALLDVIAAQVGSLGKTDAGALVTLIHALLMAVLASFWLSRWMPYVSASLGVVALLQWLSTLTGPIEGLPVALAYLALSYGLIGYGVAFIRDSLKREARPWLAIWERPLQKFSVWFSFAILALTLWLGIDLVGWTVRAMFGFSFRQIVKLETVQMAVGVLSLLGLLYVATAFTHRRLRLGYVAMGMLLAAWMLHAFYVQQWGNAAHVQWYAIPAGLYLLGIAYREWQRGNRTLARWLEYAAVLLMMGSLFWQTLLFGWGYALMLGIEGFAAFWWGSARRLRRFLYAGMMGVILATTAQLINSLRSVNQWIVFGVIGLLVVVAAIVIERKLEDIKAWRQVMETWE